MIHVLKFAFVVIFWLVCCKSDSFDDKVKLVVRNHAGVKIDTFWKAEDGRLVPQSDSYIRNGTKYIISSYPKHRFVFQVHGSSQADEGKYDAEVVMSRHEMQTTITRGNDGRLIAKSSTEATRRQDALMRGVSGCRMQSEGQSSESSPSLPSCVLEAVEDHVGALRREKDLLRSYRNQMSEKLATYMCADEEGGHTVDALIKGSRGMTVHLGGASGPTAVTVHTVVNTEGSKMYVIDDFISETECNELIGTASKSLEKATEYTGTVGNRKADAFSIFYDDVDFGSRGSVLGNKKGATAYQRIHALLNKLTGYNINIDGQEGISVLRYHPGDYYKPHCDGLCDFDSGLRVTTGSRIATALMYCRAADRGGSTIFPNLGVSVPVKPGRLVIFTYGGEAFELSGLFYGVADPNGFSRHAGCPVHEGEKWMATAWWRRGVDRRDNWSNYDAFGVQIQ